MNVISAMLSSASRITHLVPLEQGRQEFLQGQEGNLFSRLEAAFNEKPAPRIGWLALDIGEDRYPESNRTNAITASTSTFATAKPYIRQARDNSLSWRTASNAIPPSRHQLREAVRIFLEQTAPRHRHEENLEVSVLTKRVFSRLCQVMQYEETALISFSDAVDKVLEVPDDADAVNEVFHMLLNAYHTDMPMAFSTHLFYAAQRFFLNAHEASKANQAKNFFRDVYDHWPEAFTIAGMEQRGIDPATHGFRTSADFTMPVDGHESYEAAAPEEDNRPDPILGERVTTSLGDRLQQRGEILRTFADGTKHYYGVGLGARVGEVKQRIKPNIADAFVSPEAMEAVSDALSEEVTARAAAGAPAPEPTVDLGHAAQQVTEAQPPVKGDNSDETQS